MSHLRYVFSEVFDLKPTRTDRIWELVLEMIRIVPEGYWRLAGGASHRLVS